LVVFEIIGTRILPLFFYGRAFLMPTFHYITGVSKKYDPADPLHYITTPKL